MGIPEGKQHNSRADDADSQIHGGSSRDGFWIKTHGNRQQGDVANRGRVNPRNGNSDYFSAISVVMVYRLRTTDMTSACQTGSLS
ncbi:hypothetical protein [Thalassoglobus sp.]|uniref:hypothetical protein n=1 Tax=Thalassoglobus sp. TaxID=2795869 RepID=UPI003AA96DC0